MNTSIEYELITIIVPAYNHEKFISSCLNSLIVQTYPNLQLILINDGSTDRTHEVILSFLERCQRRFIGFEYISKANEGVTKTLNLGILKAAGAYILTLASDDMAAHDRSIEILYTELQKYKSLPEVAVVCGDMGIIDTEGKKAYWGNNRKLLLAPDPVFSFDTTTKYFTHWRKNFDDFDYTSSEFGSYKSILVGHYMPNGCLVKKSAIQDVGCYSADICVEDWDLWLKLSKKYTFKFINEVLFECRWHGSNAQSSKDKEIRRDIYRLIIAEKDYCRRKNLLPTWTLAYNLSRSGLIANYDFRFLYYRLDREDIKRIPADLFILLLHISKRFLNHVIPTKYFNSLKQLARKILKLFI